MCKTLWHVPKINLTNWIGRWSSFIFHIEINFVYTEEGAYTLYNKIKEGITVTWIRTLEVSSPIYLPKTSPKRAVCTEPWPLCFWISPGMDTPQLLWTTFSIDRQVSQSKYFSYV